PQPKKRCSSTSHASVRSTPSTTPSATSPRRERDGTPDRERPRTLPKQIRPYLQGVRALEDSFSSPASSASTPRPGTPTRPGAWLASLTRMPETQTAAVAPHHARAVGVINRRHDRAARNVRSNGGSLYE